MGRCQFRIFSLCLRVFVAFVFNLDTYLFPSNCFIKYKFILLICSELFKFELDVNFEERWLLILIP